MKGDLRVTIGEHGWDSVVEIDGVKVNNVAAIRVELTAQEPPRVSVDLVGAARVTGRLSASEWTEHHLCANCRGAFTGKRD